MNLQKTIYLDPLTKRKVNAMIPLNSKERAAHAVQNTNFQDSSETPEKVNKEPFKRYCTETHRSGLYTFHKSSCQQELLLLCAALTYVPQQILPVL